MKFLNKIYLWRYRIINTILILILLILILALFGVLKLNDIATIIDCRIVFDNNRRIIRNSFQKKGIKTISNLLSSSSINNYHKFNICVEELKLIDKNNAVNNFLLKILSFK